MSHVPMTVYLVYLRGAPIEVFEHPQMALNCAKERTTRAGKADVLTATITGTYTQLELPLGDPCPTVEKSCTCPAEKL